MSTDPPKAPTGLRAPGRRLWASVVGPYVLTPGELAILEQAARTADLCDRLERDVRALSELTAVGHTGQPRPHPLLAALRAERQLLQQLIGALGLPDDSRQVGMTASSRHAQHAAQTRWRKAREERDHHGDASASAFNPNAS
jgi:hypothetical protein